jgi:signal transduction histidine kinase
VLLIASDEADQALISRLASGFLHCTPSVDWVSSYDEALATIGRNDHDVYLVDSHLGSHSGLDVIAEALQQDRPAPFILLTGTGDYDLDIEALEAGATDYLVKDQLDADRLERSLRHALVHAETLAELRAARDAADAGTAAKTRFLANVSHDIRTPLTAIMGMTEIVLRDDLTPTQRDSLETVLVASESLMSLVDGLLDIAKIEVGQIDLDPAPFNVRDAVADIARISGLRASEKGIDLRVEIPNSIPETLSGDAARLQQVMIDLVSNALKYTESGHITIRVDAVESTDEKTLLQIEIEDTGVGIPADMQSTIFERSDRTTSATSPNEGTGLGVVRKIVTAMGGTVSLQSRLGKGTTIAFTARLDLPQGGASAASAGLSPASGGKVLVMASSPEDRRALESELSSGGFQPVVVGDVGAAADAAAMSAKDDQPFAAIVLDTAYKPFDIATTLADLAGGSPPVTLIVPSGREGDQPRCREAGVKGYVGKPSDPGLLVDVVRATIAAALAGDTDFLVTKDSLGTSRPIMKVLVVDDIETNLTLTVRMLTERGHQVIAVRTGIEAVDAVEGGRFDVVLMDLQMPGLDGFDTTAAIRAEEVLQGISRIPIVALTAHASMSERDRCLSAGMDGFLSKPLRPDALFAAVEQFGTLEVAV